MLILGGRQYLGIDPITGASTSLIFKIFAIYGILLPIDRMTGVGLDSINKPKKNFYKIRSQDLEKSFYDTGNFVAIPVHHFQKKKIDFDKKDIKPNY